MTTEEQVVVDSITQEEVIGVFASFLNIPMLYLGMQARKMIHSGKYGEDATLSKEEFMEALSEHVKGWGLNLFSEYKQAQYRSVDVIADKAFKDFAPEKLFKSAEAQGQNGGGRV